MSLFGSSLFEGMCNRQCDSFELVLRIYVTDLLFFGQYVMLVKGLNIESFPRIHFVPLIHDFKNSRLSSAVPYSCQLFSMSNSYVEIRL